MVEQDKAPSYEAGLPQKPANLDAKVPMQLVRKPCPKAEEGAPANGGYYFNVAQKGKLILPTALWVLLIIAGVSFLTLLASLNKTISTLDTLVELEQEKEARALVSEHLHHRQLDRQFKEASHSRGELKGGELKKAPEAAGLHRAPQPQDDWFVPTFEPTWFSMPSWTSLERVSAPAAAAAGQQQQHRPADSPKPPSPMGMVDELLHGMPPPDMILIQEGAQPQEPAGLFGALMRQVGPLLEQLTRGSKPAAAGLLDVEGDADDLPAMISAKIDNLNVHINAAPESKKAEPSREEEISSLEKSIDDLVGKLTGQRMPSAPSRKGLMDLQLESPLAEAQHKRPPAVGPFSPLASLLLGPAARQPGGRNPASMFLQSFEFDEPARNNARPGQPPMGDAQVIISISDESPGAAGKPSRETNRHQVSNTRRPSLGSSSPYEFAPLDGGLFPSPSEMMFMKLRDDGSSNNKQRLDHHAIKAGDKPADVEWDALASDLAQALVEDILGTPRERKLEAKDKKLEGEPQFLIIEQPTVLPQMTRLDNLIVPAELVNADGSSKQLAGQKGNLGAPADLLSLVFGAPSKAAAEGPKREQEDRATNEKSTAMEAASGKPTAAGKEADKAPGPQQVVAEPKLVQAQSSGEPKMSPAAKASVDSIISQLPGLSPVADEEKLARGKADELLGDFVSTMFALPQMGGERQQTSTAGAKPADNTTTTVPATAPTSTTTTTTEPSTEAATTTTTTTTTTSATSSATAPTSKPTEPTTGSRPPWIVTSVVPKEAPEKGESKINSVFNKVLGFFKGAESTKKPDDKASLASSTPTTLAPEASSRLTTSISNAPTVEIIEERESPAELPVIDLSPFAKSTKPIIGGDAEKLSKPVETATDASLTKSAPTVESSTATPAPKPASSTQGTTEPTVASSSAGPPIGSSVATGAPAEKSFLQKADDFIGRNIKSLKKLIQPGSGENKS